MTDAELRDLIEGLRRAGTDHADVEAKAAARELPKRLWETMSAFANTPGGGVIVLGIDERAGFAVCGVADPKKAQEELANLSDQMDPPIRPQIRLHRVEGKSVVVAEIPEVARSQKPCFYKGAGQNNGSFVRVGDGDRKLTGYEIQLMMASRGQPRDDEDPVPGATIDDLDPVLVRGLATEVRQQSPRLAELSNEEILRSLRALVRRDGRADVPSVAGLLALGQHPQHFFPALSAHFVVYPTPTVGAPGRDDERFLDNRRFEGPINSMVEHLLAAIRQHMGRRTLVRGAKREDVWQYPETALREAVVNSLVHRDLSSASRGSPVQVQMFPDRLRIMNPGGLFGPVTLESLGEAGVSAARNATLMRLLEDAPGFQGDRPVCENRGSGIGAMTNALRRAGMEPPQFEDRLATFQVTFPNASLLDDETLRWLSKLGTGLSETQQMGLALLRHGHVLDNTLYRQTTGLDSRVATRELGELVTKGFIEQIGTRRWATYRLTPTSPTRRDRRAEIVSLLRRRGELSRSEIAATLHITDGNARRWLVQLRDEGQVELSGTARSPSVKYRISRKGRSKQ